MKLFEKRKNYEGKREIYFCGLKLFSYTHKKNEKKIFSLVYFDISDVCNAKCPWCERGSRNIGMQEPIKNQSSRGNTFIKLEDFQTRIDFLLKRKLIDKGATIALYNWGEPLLNPHFYDIVNFLKEKGLKCRISTNGSRIIDGAVSFNHVDILYFSMPGFSQASYDKVHGFNFEETCSNIKKSIENLKKAGCDPKRIRIYVHEYQHNQLEIKRCQAFAKQLGVSFQTQHAYFNCYSFFKHYLNNTLPDHILKKAQNELVLASPEELNVIPCCTERCSQLDYLTLSHRGRLSLCCAVPLDCNEYEILDFDDYPHITYEEIKKIRMNTAFCKECMKLDILNKF